ncbi:MAG: amino acid permease [Actinobacteria bacterium]|uniref:APC family permease n=1 Tax=Propionicimonas sp. T2.31MG-18 TaxID=3157620 RepID=UPI0035EE6FDE|nr:amino acid permease [Actinomycetota bacterium]
MHKLTVAQGTALSAGAVLGAGVIALPAVADAIAGPASLVAWLALVVLSAPLAWTFGELGARFPDGGGVSAYVRRAFGTRAADAVGWIFYFAVPLGAPAACSFAGGYVADVVGGGQLTKTLTFLAIIAAVFWMNWLGLHVSGRVQLALSATLATLLLVTALAALPHADLGNLTPFAPAGWGAVGSAAALLVWAFAGWEAVSSLSPEYANPRRDVPRATMLAVIVVGVLYLSVAWASVVVLGPDLAGSQAPLADLLARGLGGPVRPVLAVVAVLLTLGTVNAYVTGACRFGAALAREGALPYRAFGTTRRSLVFVVAAAVVAQLLPIELHTLMLLVTGGLTLVYVFGTAAAVKLLPGRGEKLTAGFSLLCVCVLLWLTGWPALLGLGVAAAAVGYRAWRDRVRAARQPG